MARMTREELNAAYEASRPAVKAYLKAVVDYREDTISDAEFLAAQKARDAALKTYDAAEARFLATHCEHGNRVNDFCTGCEQHALG